MSISNVLICNIYPNEKYGIKITHPQQFIAFEIKSSMAIANAIRRVIEAELMTKRLKVEISDISTNDAFMIPENFKILLGSIPISQDISVDKVLSIDKKSDLDEDDIITTDDIKGISNYVNPKFPIATLCGKNKNISVLEAKVKDFIEFKAKITVVSNTGYVDGKHSQCDIGSSVIQPIDAPPKFYGGDSSTLSTPTHFYFKTLSRGGYKPQQMFKDVITNIISRLRDIEKVSNDFKPISDNVYSFEHETENATVAELILTGVLELYEDIELFTYDLSYNKPLIFRSRSPDLNIIIKNTVEHIIKTLNKLEQQFSKLPNEIDCYGAHDLNEKIKSKFSHLPILGENAEITKNKTGNDKLKGGWINLGF